MARRFSFSFLVLFFLVFFVKAQNLTGRPLSKLAEISIITTSPGEELYTVFGHAAIRVSDPENHADLVFGYGTFDFSTPNFYPEFVRGTLLYTLSVEPFDQFFSEFTQEPYQMKEQVLDLDSTEKANLVRLLEINYRPENRFYRYDFFYDNCATRIRDILNKALNQNNLFSTSVKPGAPSFRDLLKTYLIDRPWIRLGTDLILGTPADKKLSPEEQSFLPFYLNLNLGQSKKLAPHSHEQSLVKSERYLMNNFPPKQAYSAFTPIGFFWFLFLITILVLMQNRGKAIITILIFSLYSLLGLVILYLWLGTERTSFGLNFNLLWANPILLAILFTKHWAKRILSAFCLVLLAVLFVFMALKIQVFNSATIPLSLTLLSLLLQQAGLWKIPGFLEEKPV